MTASDAQEVAGWRYAPPYDFYNLEATPAVLAELLDGSYRSAVDPRGRVAAFFCTGEAGRVPGGTYLERDTVDVGLGLRPDLTSLRLGGPFLEDILGLLTAEEAPEMFRLTVASLNERALRLYQRVGFRTVRTFASGAWEFHVMLRTASTDPSQEIDQDR